jgi:hypothetical protein
MLADPNFGLITGSGLRSGGGANASNLPLSSQMAGNEIAQMRQEMGNTSSTLIDAVHLINTTLIGFGTMADDYLVAVNELLALVRKSQPIVF